PSGSHSPISARRSNSSSVRPRTSSGPAIRSARRDKASERPQVRRIQARAEAAEVATNPDYPAGRRLTVLGVDDVIRLDFLEHVGQVQRAAGDDQEGAAAELAAVVDGIGPPEIVLAAPVAEGRSQ